MPTRRLALAPRIASVLLVTSTSLIGLADADPAPPAQLSSARIARALDRLAVTGTVLYVAAHPDDENTQLLAWLASGRLARAVYLSLTRGEGGQNLIGSEQGPLLGLIRTEELAAARRVDGAEQRFTRARDFGYSKTWDETLAIWGEKEVLRDVVRVIREVRPDVIVTRFPPPPIAKPGDTHGHHTASAILALAAWTAAADPSFDPDSVARFGAWRATRIVWNKSLWNAKPNEDLSSFLSLDVGGYEPALGASYGEIAADSRSMHKSQGFGVARSRAPVAEYFKVLGGEPAKRDPFEGVDFTLARVKGSARFAAAVHRARAAFDPERPAASIPQLVAAWDELDRVPDDRATAHIKAREAAELGAAILACAGLYAEAVASDFEVAPGGSLRVSITVQSRQSSPNAPLALVTTRVTGPAQATAQAKTAAGAPTPLVENAPLTREVEVTIAKDAPLSNPYWLARPPSPGTWTVEDRALVGAPESPPPLAVEITLRAGARTFTITRPVSYKWTDPVLGERWRALAITPRVAIDPVEPVRMFASGAAQSVRLRLRAGEANAAGTIRLEAPAPWRAEPREIAFSLAKKGAESEVEFTVTPPALAPDGPPVTAALRAIATLEGTEQSAGLVHVDHPHIPIQTILPPADIRAVRFDLHRTRTRIGYVPGAGDEVAAALRQVGYDVTLLTDEMLRDRPLSDFQAIVTGVRAYNVDPQLARRYAKLMAYVEQGGTLVVQYNTANRLSTLPDSIGPWPFEITHDRTTSEDAPVELDAASPLLAAPNAINARDFGGWVQERGLYYAGTWDPRYQTPLTMGDPGEPKTKGALLFGKHGKGTFVYTGLSFFRQLPAGVPGAYRLFANLLEPR